MPSTSKEQLTTQQRFDLLVKTEVLTKEELKDYQFMEDRLDTWIDIEVIDQKEYDEMMVIIKKF